MPALVYTPEMDAFLLANKKRNKREVHNEFVARFGEGKSRDAITNRTYRLLMSPYERACDNDRRSKWNDYRPPAPTLPRIRFLEIEIPSLPK